MSSLLKPYTLNFKVSKPVFRLSHSNYGDGIQATLMDQAYQPPISGDVLSELVCENFIEDLSENKERFIFNEVSTLNRVKDTICSSLRKFLDATGMYKNTSQSKLFKFLYYKRTTYLNEVEDGFILLYKYLRDSGMKKDGTIKDIADPIHVKNGIAILEAMREKYEQS